MGEKKDFLPSIISRSVSECIPFLSTRKSHGTYSVRFPFKSQTNRKTSSSEGK